MAGPCLTFYRDTFTELTFELATLVGGLSLLSYKDYTFQEVTKLEGLGSEVAGAAAVWAAAACGFIPRALYFR